MTMLKQLSGAALALFLALALPAQAASFGSLKKAAGLGGGSDDDAPALDAGSLMDQQAELITQVSTALRSLSQAQQTMAEALGLKEQAAIAAANAADLEAGDLTGKDDMEKKISSSQSVDAAIQEKLAEGGELGAEGRAKFAESLLPYGVGAVAMVGSAKKAGETAKAITGSRDPQIVRKLGQLESLIYFGRQAPTLLGTFASSSGSIIKFAQSNKIDTSSLEAEVANW